MPQNIFSQNWCQSLCFCVKTLTEKPVDGSWASKKISKVIWAKLCGNSSKGARFNMDGLKFTTKYLTCSFLLVHTYWAVVFYIIGERFSDIISVIRAKLCSESIMDGILTWLVLDQVWIKSSTLLYIVSMSFGSLKLFI